MNDYVHIEAADLRRPNARFTTERQGCQVLTPFGKLGYSHVFLVLVMLAAGLSAVAGDLVALLTTPEFHGAAQVVPWIVIGALLQGVYQLTSVGLSITKRTEYYPIATGIAAVVSVSANLVLIPRFGIMGAAWANMLAYGALAASGMAFSQRYYPITYEWSRLVRLALAGVVAYMLAAAVPSATTPLPGLLIRGMVVVVCYPVLLLAISEFPKGRKYLISLSFRGKASVRPAQVGGFDVNIVIHGSTAVRGRGDLVAYRWALWKLTAPWTHRTRPPHLGKRCAFSTSSTGPFPSNHSRKTPKGPKIALGNPDRPLLFGLGFFRPTELRRICDSMTLRRAPAATAPPTLLEHREEERQMNIP